MRIVFMGTPEFGVPALEQLLEGEHQVVAVYVHPDGLRAEDALQPRQR